MDEFEKYLNKTLLFLSYRPRSEKEVRENLLKKKAQLGIIERIIKSLKEQKFLDDKDFAKWFIEQRLRFRQKSLRIIKLELKQKGVAKELIEDAINNLSYDNDGESINNDLESAIKLVEKRLPRYKSLKKPQIYQKMGAFLARRGFDWETIKKSIDGVLADKV